MQLRIDTIILFVQDIDRLRSFYVNIFQLQVVEEFPAQWLLLQAGKADNCRIGLHKIGEQWQDGTEGSFKFHNNTKIVFEVEEDLHTVRENLLKKGVSLREIQTFDNYDYWLCHGEDPEGNVFQLKQKKSS
jgi:catechol 2,3-dioxygenase-like lactoylglutathione lyase family enzyme